MGAQSPNPRSMQFGEAKIKSQKLASVDHFQWQVQYAEKIDLLTFGGRQRCEQTGGLHPERERRYAEI